ncbi:MAG: ABC transporter permease [Halodesulfurarchaeum sp.]
MSRLDRVLAEATAAYRTFLRRRTAVFFTFFFPILLIVIFAGLIRTQPTAGGLFSRPIGYYVPGYIATVVLFTPLSRVGSEVARYRDGNRFQKLATTPLTKLEWLAAQTLVNTLLIGVASALLVVFLLLLGGSFAPSLWLIPYIIFGSTLFCGVGALIGRVTSSQDGAISMANGIALPLLFLSDTFIPLSLFPSWFRPLPLLSPLTYFARGLRAATYQSPVESPLLPPMGPLGYFLVLVVLAVVFFLAGGIGLSWQE